MTPDESAARWRRVEEVLGAALDSGDPDARERLLREACAGDPALRREVDELLAAHERPGALDRLAGDLAPFAARLRAAAAPSLAGRTVGRYRVVERLAGGSMGVVYRGTDEGLGRPVALKFLHPRYAADSSAAERFRLEGRTIGALEHPNVCTVHEIGETDDGRPYIAMARYEGETLRQRLARGPLPAWNGRAPASISCSTTPSDQRSER